MSRKKRIRRPVRRIPPGKWASDPKPPKPLILAIEMGIDADKLDQIGALTRFMGMPPTWTLCADGDVRPINVYRSAAPIRHCTPLMEGDRVLGLCHGTDCGLSEAIGDLITGPRGTGPIRIPASGRCSRMDRLAPAIQIGDVLASSPTTL
ncbi:MAG: hypothetical protein ACPGVG_09440 [Mycobacterium sp.]